MRRARALLVALLLHGIAWGQGWTVQTSAFRDYRQAAEQIEQLSGLGFDAYSEFVMSNGVQYVRVRVGCFATRDGAATFARDLRGRVTAEAVAQPLSEGAETLNCSRFDTGFVKTAVWGVERIAEDIVFRVELAGHQGFLQHDGQRWNFVHSTPRPAPPDANGEELFDELMIGGGTFIAFRRSGEEPVIVCSGGPILWQSGNVAVIERPNTVVACRVDAGADGFDD